VAERKEEDYAICCPVGIVGGFCSLTEKETQTSVINKVKGKVCWYLWIQLTSS